jgi:hypothetical protein
MNPAPNPSLFPNSRHGKLPYLGNYGQNKSHTGTKLIANSTYQKWIIN